MRFPPLCEDGYRTFRVVQDYYAGDLFRGFGRGFETSFEVPLEATEAAEPRTDYDERIMARALDQLPSQPADRPFFGWSFLHTPHSPYVDETGNQTGTIDAYRDELERADAQIGRLVRTLSARGLLENTIVVVTGDHGEAFGEHGFENHGRGLYEELVRVPLVVWIPGKTGKRIEPPVSNAQVFAWLGLQTDGRLRHHAVEQLRTEISPMLRATEGSVVLESLNPGRFSAALVHGDWKLIERLPTELHELYNLDRDPSESHNLLYEERAQFEQMNDWMTEYRRIRGCSWHYRFP